MKILYLKGSKWVLSKNQQVKIDFLGYIRYKALARHIKPLKKKKWKDVSALTNTFNLISKVTRYGNV